MLGRFDRAIEVARFSISRGERIELTRVWALRERTTLLGEPDRFGPIAQSRIRRGRPDPGEVVQCRTGNIVFVIFSRESQRRFVFAGSATLISRLLKRLGKMKMGGRVLRRLGEERLERGDRIARAALERICAREVAQRDDLARINAERVLEKCFAV